MIDINVKVTKHGPIFTKTSLFPGKLHLIAQAIAKVVEDTAKDDYMNKRKTEKMPSMIFSSINYDIKESNVLVARAIVFAGGPSNDNPFYVKYVNDGHKYRNGTVFPGYHFMQEGAKEGNTQKIMITNKILKG